MVLLKNWEWKKNRLAIPLVGMLRDTQKQLGYGRGVQIMDQR